MRHLRPHTTVTVTPGGSGVRGTRRRLGAVVEPLPDVDWDSRVRELADHLGTDVEVFAPRLDEAAEAYALQTEVDLDVARTRVVGGILGALAMVTDGTDLTLDEAGVDELLATWDITSPEPGDRVLARLAVLHHQLLPDDEEEVTASPDEAGAASMASPVEGVDPAPGASVPSTLEYTLDSVPEKAADVTAWIQAGADDDDSASRARAASEVENGRETQRTTVLAAVEAVLGDAG